jgi:S-adenosylmethionine-diacylglycerol 3-amino-3-carboxypropyl transferase
MHGDVLPPALRVEHFATIRDRLERLEWHRASIESLAERGVLGAFDRANLSDIFEYMSPDNAARILHSLADVARPGARLAYWNMMVPRRASDLLPERFRRLEALSRRLFEQDKAFFYRDFVVEEVNADV